MGKSARQDRETRLAAIQAEQKKANRKRNLLMFGSLGLVLALIIGTVIGVVYRDVSTRPSLDAVETWDYPAGNHVTTTVQYAQNPPVGGEHDPVWLNCGVYDAPVRSENAVHSMEHGAVWVTYDPKLPAADVEKLKDEIPGTYMILSPYEGLPAPVVVSAWGAQLKLTGADDPRLPVFVAQYRQGPQTPEPGAACTGGTDGTSVPTTPLPSETLATPTAP